MKRYKFTGFFSVVVLCILATCFHGAHYYRMILVMTLNQASQIPVQFNNTPPCNIVTSEKQPFHDEDNENDKGQHEDSERMLSPKDNVVSTYTKADTFHTFNRTLLGTFMAEGITEIARMKNDTNLQCLNKLKFCKIKSQRTCSWCPRSQFFQETHKNGCITGSFAWNNYFVGGKVHSNIKRQYLRQVKLYSERGHDIEKKKVVTRTFQEVLFNCTFSQPLPVGVPGKLIIPWASDDKDEGVLLKNGQGKDDKVLSEDYIPLSPMLTRKDQRYCAVCGRGIFGKFDAVVVAKYVEHYIDRGFGTVFLYQTGFFQITRRALLEPYIREKKLIIIDLRSTLHALHGYKAHFTLYRSYSMGQYWQKLDCALRTFHMGFKWALHVDFDEFLFPAPRKNIAIEKAGPKFNYIENYTQNIPPEIMWHSFGMFLNNDERTLCPDNNTYIQSSNRRSHFNWRKIDRVIDHIHTEVELSNYSQYLQYVKDKCDDPLMCNGHNGLRKVMMRTEAFPLALRVHGVSKTMSKGKVVHASKAYLRHVKCIKPIDFTHSPGNKT